MFERFTKRARRVIVLAQEEARILKHNHIGTEHILLGLLREEEGLAARALESLDIALERVRAEVVRTVDSDEEVSSGRKEITSGQIPFTPAGKKALELALREALSLDHNYIGSEHILLGLVRDGGLGARILLLLGADAERVRAEVLRMLAHAGGGRRVAGEPKPTEDSGLPDSLVEGASRLVETVAREVEQQLDRPADAGDLLVALASLPEGLVARTVARLGIDAATLKQAVDEARREGAYSGLLPPTELVADLEAVRSEKFEKIEAQEFEAAARLRDRELQLVDQAGTMEDERLEAALAEVRRQLGLAGD